MTAKADRIQRLLNDPDLIQAFEDVRDALHKGFEQTPPSDVEQLIGCRYRLQVLGSVKANLLQAIEDGKLEDFNEQDEQSPLGDLDAWTRTVSRNKH